jgi:hypothetical protein
MSLAMTLALSEAGMIEQNSTTKPKRERRAYQKHGLHTMKRALVELGSRAIDGRTALAKGMSEWRRDYINDLGGPEAVSTAALTILDKAATTDMLIRSIDAWIVNQPTIVNKRKRALFPIIMQRQTLVDSLVRLLSQLGLERKQKPAQSIQDLIREIDAKKTEQVP